MPVAAGTATRTKRKRGEGQWALGYREPLNKNEENKRNDDGLNVRQRIIDIYSKYGFDSIDPADLRGRFRWYGLYTQRRPGIDGGQDRGPGARGARRPLLHAAGPHRRRPARPRPAARDRGHLPPVRPRHGRRHRPAEHPAALDRDRERARDLGRTGVRGAEHHRGLRGHAPGDPRLPAGRPGRARDHRRHARDRRDHRAVHRRPGVLQPAAEVQVLGQRLLRPVRHPRDQRRGVRGRAQRRRRSGL